MRLNIVKSGSESKLFNRSVIRLPLNIFYLDTEKFSSPLLTLMISVMERSSVSIISSNEYRHEFDERTQTTFTTETSLQRPSFF